MALTVPTCKVHKTAKDPEHPPGQCFTSPVRCYEKERFKPTAHSSTTAHLSKHFPNDQHTCWLVRCVGRFLFSFFLSCACVPNCENTFPPWGEYITPAVQSQRFSAPKLAGVKCNAGKLMFCTVEAFSPPPRSKRKLTGSQCLRVAALPYVCMPKWMCPE